MKDKIKDIILIILFLIIVIVGFVLNVAERDKEISISERRKLKQLPEIEKIFDGNYSDEFEKYAADQFINRDYFRNIKEKVHFNILKQNDNNGLFINDGSVYKQTGLLNEKEVKKATNKFKNIKDKFLDNSNNVYYSIVPDKNYYLDDNKLNMDYKKLEEIMNQNLEDSMKYIEIFSLLNKDDFYKTDTHWKQENLGKVANKLLDGLSTGKILTIENIETKGDFLGVYGSQLVGSNDMKDSLKYITNETINMASTFNFETNKEEKIYDENKWKTSNDKYDYFVSGASPLIEIRNNLNKDGKELVIFRDSFGSSIAPLLLEGYSKIILVDLRYISSNYLGQFVDFKGKDVLFLHSTLILNESSILK